MEAEKLQKKLQKQIAKLRKEKNLTQEELAYKVGITPKALSDIENNRRNVSFKTFIKICIALDVKIALEKE